MKFTYVLLKKRIPKLNTLSDVFALIRAAQECGRKPNIEYESYDEIVTGGCFFPDDLKTQVKLTSEFLIRENKDQTHANINYMASFFGESPTRSEYIGKWSDSIDANANIYYVIFEGEIRKIIFSKPIDMGQPTDAFGAVYIIEHEGNMIYCTPDEGDVMFDNKKEAKQYLKEHSVVNNIMTLNS